MILKQKRQIYEFGGRPFGTQTRKPKLGFLVPGKKEFCFLPPVLPSGLFFSPLNFGRIRLGLRHGNQSLALWSQEKRVLFLPPVMPTGHFFRAIIEKL
jgi:hypothetical protein